MHLSDTSLRHPHGSFQNTYEQEKLSVRLLLQYVAWLAVESLADGIEGGEIGNMLALHLCK